MKISFGAMIWVLLFCHLIYTLFVTGNFILFNSSLRLWLNPDYFYSQKIETILWRDHGLANQMSNLPVEENYLAVSTETLWFLNYYLFPRKLFWYKGVTKEQDLPKVPAEWLRQRNISQVIMLSPSELKMIRLDVKQKP
jgi:hypothetical protein